MTDKLVSVAMCTYNGARFLKQQLDSILAQSYRHIELVIFDDCSTDETWAILEEYAGKDGRVRLFQNEINLGFVKNFENAIAECRADLIALADQDDVWFEQKIEHLVRGIGDNLLVYSRVSLIDAEGNVLGEEFPGAGINCLEGDCALSLVLGNCVTGHACLLRRELFDKAREYLSSMRYHDQWLAIVAAAEGRLKADRAVLSYYRRHDNNVVFKNKKKRKVAKHVAVIKKLHEQLVFLDTIAEANVLSREQEKLLGDLRSLMARNESSFFNTKLRNFLMKHEDIFLRVFSNKPKFVNKICRGKWYFIFIPFA